MPFFDFAYQGFAEGIDEDAAGLRLFAEKCGELAVASSYSKNFGLYNERVGAITILCDSAESAEKVISQVKIVIRRCYSNPPSHGGAIVTIIMNDEKLRCQWISEVTQMRQRMREMRQLLVKTLKDKGAKDDFSFITKQNGMFSYSGLNTEQVKKLREEHSIYIVGSGRINVAGISTANIDTLCEAIVSVL